MWLSYDKIKTLEGGDLKCLDWFEENMDETAVNERAVADHADHSLGLLAR